MPKCIPSGTPLGDVPGTLRWQVHGTPKLGIAGKDHGFFIWFSSVLKCMFCPLPYLHTTRTAVVPAKTALHYRHLSSLHSGFGVMQRSRSRRRSSVEWESAEGEWRAASITQWRLKPSQMPNVRCQPNGDVED